MTATADRYLLLASDFDETLAERGRVSLDSLRAIERLQASGRRFVVVTGRRLNDLRSVFPAVDICDRVVAENGPVVYCPATGERELLAAPPPPAFIEALSRRGIEPLEVGEVVVATREPHAAAVLEVIQEMGLELQVIFNKGGVMVLPPSVNKGVGLSAVLGELGVGRESVVAVGDAENDHSLLALAGFPVAVANALPGLKERAAMVLPGGAGEGVRQLIELLLADGLRFAPDTRTTEEKHAPVAVLSTESTIQRKGGA